MTNLPAVLRADLAASLPYSTLAFEHEARSRDGRRSLCLSPNPVAR
jgi:hypothetical protein